jgi:hypothetical protein
VAIMTVSSGRYGVLGEHLCHVAVWTLRENGEWLSDGEGGSFWPAPYGERPSSETGSGPKLTGFTSALRLPGGEWMSFATGIAPAGVSAVRVACNGTSQIVAVEERTGAFLAQAAGRTSEFDVSDAGGVR